MINFNEFVKFGISVIPVLKNKIPFFNLLPNHKWDIFQTRLPNADEINQWQKANPPGIAVVCGAISGNLEVIDIDNHNGNATRVLNEFKEIVNACSDSLWQKLFIERSQSNGYHLIYRFYGKPEGSMKLASQLLDGKKDTFIETKGEGGYVVVSPSPGYTVLQNSIFDITIISDAERNLLLQIARSFNEIENNEVTSQQQQQQQQPKSNSHNKSSELRPGDRFNELGDHHKLLIEAGWTLINVTSQKTELWRRPGKKFGISATFNHIPNKFYVFSTNAQPFENNRTYDKFAIYTLLKHNGDFQQSAKHLSDDYPELFNNVKILNSKMNGKKNNVIPRFPPNETAVDDEGISASTDIQFAPNTIFWKETQDSQKKPKLIISKAKLINFLEYHNFGKIWLDKNVSSFIRIRDQIVTLETPETIIDFIKDNLMALPDGNITNYFTKQDIWEACLNNISKLKSRDFLETIKLYDINFIKDTKDKCYFFFKNCIVEITKDKITTKPYNNAKGFIWHDQIIDHNFTLLSEDLASNPYNSMFGRFLQCVCSPANPQDPQNRSARVVDADRFTALQTAIGYLLHTYQNPSITKAVVFCEERISADGEANGRTGKGLTAKALSKMRKRVSYDGKLIDFNDKFFYQKISPDTQLIYLDDVKKNFDFESLFSVLTEGFFIEYKGKSPIEVKFSDVPKFLISTNSVLAKENDSHKARKFEIEFSDYFSADYTPVDEFGGLLLDAGWAPDDPEWDWFYNFMISCVKLYLNEGLHKYTPVNLAERKLMANVNEEFLEYAEDILLPKLEKGEKIYRDDLYNDFINTYKTYALNSKFAIKGNSTTRWFNEVLKLKNIDFREMRETTRNNRNRYWILTKFINTNPIEDNEVSDDNNNEELPF